MDVRRWFALLRLAGSHILDVERIYRAMLPMLPIGELESIRRRYSGMGVKYADYRYFLRLNIARVLSYNLDTAAPLRLLDLGCGAGWFMLVVNYFDHVAHGLDMPGYAVYDDLLTALNMSRMDHVIRPFKPLPDVGIFDMLTAHAVTFDRAKGQQWGKPEWTYFLQDARTHLNASGRLALALNDRVTPELIDLFATAPGWNALTVERGCVVLVKDDK